MARILLVDDDVVFLKTMRQFLVGERHEVTVAESDLEAGELLAKNRGNPYDVIVADMKMGPKGNEGMNVLRDALRNDPFSQVIVLTGYGTIANCVEAMEKGALTYLEKRGEQEAEPNILLCQIKKALEHRDLLFRIMRLKDMVEKALVSVQAEVKLASLAIERVQMLSKAET
jgi:DNA-binding NtrC family response regulator